jgi:hypothetical protein
MLSFARLLASEHKRKGVSSRCFSACQSRKLACLCSMRSSARSGEAGGSKRERSPQQSGQLRQSWWRKKGTPPGGCRQIRRSRWHAEGTPPETSSSARSGKVGGTQRERPMEDAGAVVLGAAGPKVLLRSGSKDRGRVGSQLELQVLHNHIKPFSLTTSHILAA